MVPLYAAMQQVADTDRSGLRFVVWVADLEAAMDKLDLLSWQVVLLCGLIGIPQETAAKLLQTSQRSVSRRYTDALEDIHWFINGGTYD